MTTTAEPKFTPVEVIIDQLTKLNQAIQDCAGHTDWKPVVLRDQSSGMTLVAAEYAKEKGIYPRLSKVLPNQQDIEAFFTDAMVKQGKLKKADVAAKLIDAQGNKIKLAKVKKTFDELCYEAAAQDTELQKINDALGMPTHGSKE